VESRRLNSLGVSRLHIATGTTKIEQLKDFPNWEEAKALLKRLRHTGLLTLKEAVKNRLVIQWEPRVFPDEETKSEAQQTLGVITHDLTLAFANHQDRDEFLRWINEEELLSA
jgi:hypothetical protein